MQIAAHATGDGTARGPIIEYTFIQNRCMTVRFYEFFESHYTTVRFYEFSSHLTVDPLDLLSLASTDITCTAENLAAQQSKH